MTKYVAYENSYIDLSCVEHEVFKDFVEIGAQIKDELGLISTPLQYVSSNRIYVGNIVGNIALNDTNLLILPKFVDASSNFEEISEGLNKRLFTRTLKCAAGSLNSTVYFNRNTVVDDEGVFFDALAKYFIDTVVNALRKSKIFLYEDFIEKSATIKGKILVRNQLSQPISDEKTWCKFKRMTDNNIYNQLLYWACKYLSELTQNFDFKRKMISVGREFPQETNLLSFSSVELLRTPRQFSHYAECIALAKSLYLKNAGKKEKLVSGNHICGYVINMERSFENMVNYYIRIASAMLGYSHKPQAVMRFAWSSHGREYDYDVRPDDLITDREKHLVVDAKYKAISRQDNNKKKPSRDDFYQMVSSCIAYNCSEAILIYPLTNAFPLMSWKTIHEVNGSSITVRAAAINLMRNEEDVINAFADIIKHTIFYREKTI